MVSTDIGNDDSAEENSYEYDSNDGYDDSDLNIPISAIRVHVPIEPIEPLDIDLLLFLKETVAAPMASDIFFSNDGTLISSLASGNNRPEAVHHGKYTIAATMTSLALLYYDVNIFSTILSLTGLLCRLYTMPSLTITNLIIT